MSFPTVLSPWYVVQRHRPIDVDPEGCVIPEFYSEVDGGPVGVNNFWTEHQKYAMLFMSLHSAVRVARAADAEVRVLTSKEEVDEFRPKEVTS